MLDMIWIAFLYFSHALTVRRKESPVNAPQTLTTLRGLLLQATKLAADLAADPSLIGMEDLSERVDMAYLAVDDVRGVTLEDLDDWAAEARTDRRIDEAREAA